MNLPRTIAIASAAAGILASAASDGQPPDAIFGFSAAGAAAERRIEARFLALPSETRARDFHRYLTAAAVRQRFVASARLA